MFLCTPCLQTNFTNPESGFKSHGKCELCGQQGICNEIAGKYLEAKIKRLDPIPFREGIEVREDSMIVRQRMTREQLRQMGYLPLEQI